MRLESIIERLRDRCPEFHSVGGAAEFERASQSLTVTPAAFVLPAREAATESPFMSQIVEQEIAVEFVVLIAAVNVGDNEGAAALESLEPIRESVRKAILGWQPNDASAGCQFQSGELLHFEDSVLWWNDSFSTTYVIRSE